VISLKWRHDDPSSLSGPSKTASADLARRVAVALGLPPDYFPEFREAFVVEHIRRDADLRERLYKQLRTRR
jgi:hypothetical protein